MQSIILGTQFFFFRFTFTTLSLVFFQNKILNNLKRKKNISSLRLTVCMSPLLYDQHTCLTNPRGFFTRPDTDIIASCVLRRLIQIALTRIQDLLSSRLSGRMQLQRSLYYTRLRL